MASELSMGSVLTLTTPHSNGLSVLCIFLLDLGELATELGESLVVLADEAVGAGDKAADEVAATAGEAELGDGGDAGVGELGVGDEGINVG